VFMRDLRTVSNWTFFLRRKDRLPIVTGGGRADAKNHAVEVELAHVRRLGP
jgi:hypothetical protein